jgi:hypothetical protein
MDDVLDLTSLQASIMNTIQFIVPQKHLQQHWKQFSRSTGDVKFLIRREGVNFTLCVPGDNPIRLNAYQEAYGHVDGHTL